MFPTCQLRAGFLYLLVLLVIPLAQQANASSWTGVLRDASRNPVASAKIEIRAVNGHPIRDATTAADGTFLISGITAGAYHISVAYHQRVWSASKSVTLRSRRSQAQFNSCGTLQRRADMDSGGHGPKPLPTDSSYSRAPRISVSDAWRLR
ncbi:MAG: hypothetical protein DMG81_12305 [Acidobacteria bacterium]|nr:MAG: hypothetical protein DMG81_12305 [Acidobacteriota bacterium]